MSESRKDGGPAFPRSMGQTDFRADKGTLGMSLRDYFAAAALTGWLSDPNVVVHETEKRQRVAEMCYLVADAMLAERTRDGTCTG